jgi:hypothetical protein
MYTIGFWVNKGEMRVIRVDVYNPEMKRVKNAPTFDNPETGWQWIRKHYPQHHP